MKIVHLRLDFIPSGTKAWAFSKRRWCTGSAQSERLILGWTSFIEIQVCFFKSNLAVVISGRQNTYLFFHICQPGIACVGFGLWAMRRRSHGLPNQLTSGHVTCAVRFFSRKFQYIEEDRGNVPYTIYRPVFVSLLWLRTFGLGDLVSLYGRSGCHTTLPSARRST